MITDLYPRRSKQRDTVTYVGRWPGSGAPANGVYPPSTRPDGGAICKGLVLTRTAAGLYTLTLAPLPGQATNAVPFILRCIGSVVSPGATAYTMIVLTEVASTGTVTTKIINAAGAAADPIANETIEVILEVSSAGQP